ncbi:FAD-dependent oxidoreductase [Streptomyces nigrescens]|uniref:FAD-dependent oxidoreductase n=1 Tax=Streptomyces nigrescens TaxID=1920 RepID=UPI0036F58FC3
MSNRADADLIVVGAGPAGVSAAVTAASVGMKTVLIESDQVGAKVRTIGSLENLVGGWTNGPELADALTRDVVQLEVSGRCHVEKARAVGVNPGDAAVQVVLADGRVLSAAAVVVATGVASLGPRDVPWLDAPANMSLVPLWRAKPADLEGARTVVALGADRPLGTWLRAHPSSKVHLRVLHPQADRYKTDEVAQDPRVTFETVERVSLAHTPEGVDLTVHSAGTGRYRLSADVVVMNAGSKPAGLAGLTSADDGYCPVERQPPGVLIAGDLKGPRMQRIAIAMGDGQRSALTPYYEGIKRITATEPGSRKL